MPEFFTLRHLENQKKYINLFVRIYTHLFRVFTVQTGSSFKYQQIIDRRNARYYGENKQMALYTRKPKPVYAWRVGDLIGTTEAAALLGYKSPKILQDKNRRQTLIKEFESVGCALTDTIKIGGGRRFLRSEIDAFLSRKLELVGAEIEKRNKDLRIAA
jgi:AraC-like DNA-binding protein